MKKEGKTNSALFPDTIESLVRCDYYICSSGTQCSATHNCGLTENHTGDSKVVLPIYEETIFLQQNVNSCHEPGDGEVSSTTTGAVKVFNYDPIRIKRIVGFQCGFEMPSNPTSN